jgi:hypothetical protein
LYANKEDIMNKTVYITVILAMLLLSSVAIAKTIEVPLSQIAVISPEVGEHDLSLGPRVCLKFALPEEVRGVEIGFAQVVMHFTLPVDSEDSLALFEAFALASNWSDGTRWNDFSVHGGDIDSNYYATYTHWCGRDSLASFDITHLAQKWNETPESNHGILIIARKTDFSSFRQFQFLPGQLRSLITLKIIVPGRQE